MFTATLKSLAAHKVRLALTALAIVIGVAFMAGTFVLTDTIKAGINSLFSQTVAGRTVVVRGVSPFSAGNRGGGGFGGNRPLTPASLLPVVKQTPGVAAADGSVQGIITLVGPNGRAIKATGGAPTVALAWVPDRSLSSLVIKSGRGAERDGEVVIDSVTAQKSGLGPGQRVSVIGNGPPEPFTIVGVATFGKAGTIGGARFGAFDTATAQRIAGKPGYFNEIDVQATSGTDTDALLARIGAELPKGFEVIGAQAAAAQNAKSVDSFINIFNTILLVFALIALFVGAFLIFNTFSILVGQRTQELALLRALGASRSQIIASVVGEAALTGVIGGVIGLVGGILLAAALDSALKSAFSLGASHLQILPRTIIVSILAGAVITVVSAVGPAVRASRIPPIAALRDDAVLAESSLRRRAISGGIVFAVGALLLAGGLFGGSGVAAVGFGAAITFIGIAMLIPFVIGPLALALGSPLPVISGITGRLGRENAARNPRRTAATASALMIGLAVVSAIATLAGSATASFSGIFDNSIRADYVVTSSTFALPPAVASAVRTAPGVTATSPFAETTIHVGNVSKQAAGIDATGGPQVFVIKMLSGSVTALAHDQVLVDDATAKSSHLTVGSAIAVQFVATGAKSFVVGGVFKTNQFLDPYVFSSTVLDANTSQPRDDFVLIRVNHPSAAEQAAIVRATAAYPQISIKTGAQFKADQKNQVAGFLKIVYVLLAFSILIALIGVVNTLALSVLERTREIGLLRAIGMVRRQVRSMIRGEAVLVSVLGAVLGLVLGVVFGAAIVSAVSGNFITKLVIPVGTIVTVLILTALFGIFAAVFPARRAARLDVLRAISTA